MASGSGKAKASSWAAAMGTVEALKEHYAGGVTCRWSHALRDVVQRTADSAAAAGRSGACGSKSKPLHPAAGGAGAAARRKAKQEQEEELRTVMYLSNWGPNN